MHTHLQRIRFKLCGLTRLVDIPPVVNSGADAIGLVFYPHSKRYVSIEQAAQLCAQIPAFVTVTALFVNPEADFVNEVIAQTKVDLLQFHGDESPDFCRQFSRPYIKAFRIGAPGHQTATELIARCRQFHDARGWLFDSYTPAYGGSGVAFDEHIFITLQKLCDSADAPLIVAGGLNEQNIKEKVKKLRPFAVDVSSGIELSPGIKCPTKITAFVQAFNAARD